MPRTSDLLAGVVAGAAGTLAMDVLQYRLQHGGLFGGGEGGHGVGGSDSSGNGDGGDDDSDRPSFAQWELSTDDITSFDDAGAPAEVGRRLAAWAGYKLPDERAGLTQDVVHWATGVAWGTTAASLAATSSMAAIRAGVMTGIVAFGTAYAALGRAGIYQPIWEYDRSAVAKDLAGHLVYGAATGLALTLMRRGRR